MLKVKMNKSYIKWAKLRVYFRYINDYYSLYRIIQILLPTGIIAINLVIKYPRGFLTPWQFYRLYCIKLHLFTLNYITNNSIVLLTQHIKNKDLCFQHSSSTLYMHIFLYFSLHPPLSLSLSSRSSSSSSSSPTVSTDFFNSVSLFVSIIYHSWQVLQTKSSVCTELLALSQHWCIHV